ncbi:hypothetical protein Mnod_3382 [Methylobacterium nodulans ORS 2060]|uniref:Uncharacterized protein n=1 Tax=Methylobacterium nodulans (strain LMG 21967 / CNCM I-2342 / ORS 2060) TaxID=460265 RepID=B8IMB6_METNO|nr:hypothetical protein Mnod_3382 [Methylobacterium nodulans ORS 2060]
MPRMPSIAWSMPACPATVFDSYPVSSATRRTIRRLEAHGAARLHIYAESLRRGGYLISVHASDERYERVLDRRCHGNGFYLPIAALWGRAPSAPSTT